LRPSAAYAAEGGVAGEGLRVVRHGFAGLRVPQGEADQAGVDELQREQGTEAAKPRRRKCDDGERGGAANVS
jgi:hypothetical protein